MQSGTTGGRIRALALMAAGIVVLGLGALRFVTASNQDAPTARQAGSGVPCVDHACRTNADPRPVRGYEAPSVAGDPADPEHVVVGDINLVGGQCGWHVTFDGGRNWEDGVFELPAGFAPCGLDSGGFIPMGNVAFGPSGRLYGVLSSAGGYAAGRRGEGESILLVRSDDAGRSFGRATVAVPGGRPAPQYLRPVLTVARGPAGNDILLVSFWGCADGRCDRAVFARSDDGGATFSPPVLVSPPPGGNSPSQAALAADGSVSILFLRRPQAGDVDLVLARSTDEGRSFQTNVIGSEPGIGLRYDAAKLVVDPPRNALLTAFSVERAGNPSVYFRRSPDGGRSWSPAQLVNRRGNSFSPSLSVAPGGSIDLVYYQRRTKEIHDAIWASSTDRGVSIGPERQLNDRGISRRVGYWEEVGDFYTPALWSSDQRVLLAWSDTRNGDLKTDTQEIYLRALRVGDNSRPLP